MPAPAGGAPGVLPRPADGGRPVGSGCGTPGATGRVAADEADEPRPGIGAVRDLNRGAVLTRRAEQLLDRRHPGHQLGAERLVQVVVLPAHRGNCPPRRRRPGRPHATSWAACGRSGSRAPRRVINSLKARRSRLARCCAGPLSSRHTSGCSSVSASSTRCRPPAAGCHHRCQRLPVGAWTRTSRACTTGLWGVGLHRAGGPTWRLGSSETVPAAEDEVLQVDEGGARTQLSSPIQVPFCPWTGL